jgi:hypothetical protein
MTALFRLDASDTSIMAAESIDQTRLEALVLEAIKASGSKGITQDELLGKFPHFSYSSITARPAALKRKGLVKDSGARRLGRSGRSQMVLIATEQRG